MMADNDAGAALHRPTSPHLVDSGRVVPALVLPRHLETADADLRLLTLNGAPLSVDGVYASSRLFNEGEDARSNVSAGGEFEMAEPDRDALRLANLVTPELKQDGMYLARLGIASDNMMEINVDTLGGINMAEDLIGKDFSGAVLGELERKVALHRHDRGCIPNADPAML